MFRFLKWPIVVSVLVAIGGWGATVDADDIMPPEWRGQPNSVMTEFQSDGVNDPLERTAFTAPAGGFPLFEGDPDGESGPVQEGDGPRVVQVQPFTPSGGIWTIYMPNVVDDLPVKFFQVQITYTLPSNPDNRFPSKVEVAGGEPIDDVVGPELLQQIPLTPSSPDDPDRVYEKWGGQIFPNPDFEFFRIEVPGNLDQVVIDTISIPEPGTGLLALVFCGAGLLRRRAA